MPFLDYLGRTTKNDSSLSVRQREQEIQHLSAHIIEQNVEFPDCLSQLFLEIRVLVVDSFVDSEIIFEVFAFLIRAGDSDDF